MYKTVQFILQFAGSSQHSSTSAKVKLTPKSSPSSVKPTSKVWKSQLKEYYDKKYKGKRTEIRYVSKECPRGGFMSTVYCPDIGWADGEGPNKLAAEHNAAYNALKRLESSGTV